VFSPVKAGAINSYYRLRPGLYQGQSPLVTRRFDNVAFPGEELVVVTSPMFPHKISKGYGDPAGQVVKDVNGVAIKNLGHLVETIRDSQDKFLRFRFADLGSEMLVFDRQAMAKATEEVMEDNGILATRRGSADMMKVWNKK